MKYHALKQLEGQQMNISARDMWHAGAGVTNCAGIQVSMAMPKASKLLGMANGLNVVKDPGGKGVWVPYLANKNFYAHIGAGCTWAASGPFSGCFFEIGKMGGKVYAAHVSNEGENSPNLPEWEKTQREVWFRAKIGMSPDLPKDAMGAAGVVFATGFGSKAEVEVTRVDAMTMNPGSMVGPIFSVKRVDNQAT